MRPPDRRRGGPDTTPGRPHVVSPPTATDALSVHAWYRAGLEHGIELGRQLAEEDMVAATRTAVEAARTAFEAPGLELRRWGPGGREHFADPRPGDFQGRAREVAA